MRAIVIGIRGDPQIAIDFLDKALRSGLRGSDDGERECEQDFPHSSFSSLSACLIHCCSYLAASVWKKSSIARSEAFGSSANLTVRISLLFFFFILVLGLFIALYLNESLIGNDDDVLVVHFLAIGTERMRIST